MYFNTTSLLISFVSSTKMWRRWFYLAAVICAISVDSREISLRQQLQSVSRDLSSEWELIPGWGGNDLNRVGQVGGVCATKSALVVFHRGDVTWGPVSFTMDNRYTGAEESPISVPTVLTFSKEGKVIDAWGENMFYMPHGIYVTRDGDVWVTDVALHQVMKFSNHSRLQPDIVLGERFEPGDSERQFCKPAAVTVDEKTGDIFIADGYCNSRVVKYDRNGRRLLQWGRASGTGLYALSVPHGLVLRGDQVLVADREHGRVVRYMSLTGMSKTQWSPGGRVYGITSGAEIWATGISTNGPYIWGQSGDIPLPKNAAPHDLDIQNDTRIYIGSLTAPYLLLYVRKAAPNTTDVVEKVDARALLAAEDLNEDDSSLWWQWGAVMGGAAGVGALLGGALWRGAVFPRGIVQTWSQGNLPG